MKKTISILLFLMAFSVLAQPVQIYRYEYWFNRQVDDKVVADITPEEQATIQLNLSAAHLPDGLNSVTLRFRDSETLWSAALTRFFVKLPIGENGGTERHITALAYRFNQGELTHQLVTPAQSFSFEETLLAASLPDGLNSFSIRFRDNTGMWSAMLTRFFVKMPVVDSGTGEPRQIVSYAYRFNQGAMQQQNVTATADISIDEIISAADLPDGLNSFSIRFQDDAGLWSAMLTRFFVKMPMGQGGVEDNALTAYQLWFNEDVAGMQQVAIENGTNFVLAETLAAADLPDGLNRISIRFRDEKGLWSSVLTRFFVKHPVPQQQEENLMTAYEYWLEDSEGNLYNQNGQPGTTHIALEQPQNPLLLDLGLDLHLVPHGEYHLMFRFLDTRGHWSAVLASQIEKTPYPWALFEASQTSFCGSGMVNFANFSIDADEYLWDFGDGATSNEAEPQHDYTGEGSYTVSLTATWSATGQSHTLVHDDLIVVNAEPQPEIVADGPLSFCQGGSVTLSANLEGEYLWSTGATTSSIVVDETGDYWLQLTDANQCSGTSETISVEVYELPQVNILLPDNEPLCEGEEVTISVMPEGTYLWTTGETTQEIVVTQTGTYGVSVTDANGCTGTAESDLMFHPIPQPAFLYAIDDDLVNFTNTSQDAQSYLWDFGDGNQSDQENPQHNYAEAGAYEVCLTAFTDVFCQDVVCQTLQITTTVNSIVAQQDLKVWPVPFDASLVIEPDPKRIWQLLEVYNAAGHSILRQSLADSTGPIRLDTSYWAPGVYTLILFCHDGQRAIRKTLKR